MILKQTLLSLFFLSLLPLNVVFAQQPVNNKDVAGSWSGAIRAGGQELNIIFHIKEAENKLTATMDVPAQGAQGIPVQSVKVSQDSLFLDIQAIGGSYAGKITGPETIDGQWKQPGLSLPLQLQKGMPEALKRPQEPKKPYPYQEQEISVENEEAGIRLAGTLTIPQGEGPHPAVLLFSGSGPQDRDETVMGHKPFLVLADHLTHQGFAVLRLDDRGVGKSEGNFANSTTKDFVSDAQAAYNFLKNHPKISPKKIGLIGHSEGALVVAEVAAQQPQTAFVILMAGSAVPGPELLMAQSEAILKVKGLEPELLQKYLDLRKEQFAVAATESDAKKAAAQILKLEQEAKADLTEQEQQQLGLTPQNEQAAAAQLSSPWMRYFLAYNPAQTLQKLKMPVLVMIGSKDVQVPAAQNLPAAEKALKAAKNKRYTIKELPNLNHLFQNATTGSPEEYGLIEETLAPVALELISSWAKEVVK